MKIPITLLISWLGLSGVIVSQIVHLLFINSHSIAAFFLIFIALLPIKGMLNNKRYTFQWSGFLAMLFFLWGVSDFFVTSSWMSSSFLLLISSIVFYFGTVFHAKRLAHFSNSNHTT